MRNLKRALSLTLASVMLLGMMVVGAGAAGFPDVDEDNANIEAIEVLQAVEVMIGDDNGNFGPNDPVNRSQMAVVMAKLLNLDYQYYEASCPFWDVPTWARPYVGACYANKIVSGYGDGTYGAADGVTPVQAASMMMRALGYFQHSEDYQDGFETATVRQGTEVGIFEGVGSSATANMTRAQVARMALNALESEMVTFTGVPGVTVGDATIGYRAEYTPRTSTETKYQAIEKRTSDVSGGNNLNRGQYYIQLGEELYNGKLTKKYDTDDFERPSINWQFNGKEIGVYVDYDLLVAGGSFTNAVKYSELYNLLTFTTINDNSLYRYVDGVDQKESKDKFSRSNKDEVGGTGVLTEVFYNQDREEITITSINTYLAKANSDYNKTNETLSLKVYETNGTGTTKIVDSEDVEEAAGVAKDDFRLVYMSGKNNAAKLEVVKIFDVEIMTGSQITKWSKHDTKVVDKLTTEGTEYKTNPKAYYDKNGDVLLAYNEQRLTDTSYNIFMDRYNNVIGVDLYEGTKNYVFITGYDRIQSNISVKTADAAAIFMDGTMDIVTVNVTDTDKNIRKAGSNNYIEWSQYSYEGVRDLNRWYTYTQAANGNYTLKPVDRFFYTSYDSVNDFDNKGVKVLNTANLYLNDSNKTNGYNNKGRIYGNDDSVYITVEPGYVDTSKPTGSHDAITDVKGVYTGAQDVKLEITTTSKELVNERKGEDHTTSVYPNTSVDYTKVDYDKWNAPYEQNAYVYSIYDSNYYIIASVVLGDAQGATANYAYILDDAKSEWVERGSGSRSTSDDTYFWEFEAVLNGEKQTLTVKSKYEDTIDDLRPYHMQELRFDGDYVTAIKDVDSDKVMITNTDEWKTDEYDVYDVGHTTTAVAQAAWADSQNIHTAMSDRNIHSGSGEYTHSNHRIDGTIELVGRTLYTERPHDVGLALTSDAKAVLIQKENKSVETIQCDSVAEAIGRLADADTRDIPAADGIQFHGRIVAVLDSAGAAKWVVIISDTLLLTGNQPSYGDTSDLRWVQYNASTGTGRYWELYIPGYVDATTVSSETIRNALASNGCSDISRNGSNWNFYRNGTRYENQVVRVVTTYWGDDTIHVTGVTLDKATATVKAGEKVTLTATVAPSNATNKAVTWTSSDNTVATVSNGVVTGVKAGTATITVTTADRGYTASCTVTVDDEMDPEAVSVNVTKGYVNVLKDGKIISQIQDKKVVLTETVKKGDTITVQPANAVEITAGLAEDGTVNGDITISPKTGYTWNPFVSQWEGPDGVDKGDVIEWPLAPAAAFASRFSILRSVVRSGELGENETNLNWQTDENWFAKAILNDLKIELRANVNGKDMVLKVEAKGTKYVFTMDGGTAEDKAAFYELAENNPDAVTSVGIGDGKPSGATAQVVAKYSNVDWNAATVDAGIFAWGKVNGDGTPTAEQVKAALETANVSGIDVKSATVNAVGNEATVVLEDGTSLTATLDTDYDTNELFEVKYPGVSGTTTVYVEAGAVIEDIADSIFFLMDGTYDYVNTAAAANAVDVTAKTPTAKSSATLTGLAADVEYVEAYKIDTTDKPADKSGSLQSNRTTIVTVAAMDKATKVPAALGTEGYLRKDANLYVALDAAQATADNEGKGIKLTVGAATDTVNLVIKDGTVTPATVAVNKADATGKVHLKVDAPAAAPAPKVDLNVILNDGEPVVIPADDANISLTGISSSLAGAKVYYLDPADGELKDTSAMVNPYNAFTWAKASAGAAIDENNTVKLYTVYTVNPSGMTNFKVYEGVPGTEGIDAISETIVVKTIENKTLYVEAQNENTALKSTAFKLTSVVLPSQKTGSKAVYTVKMTGDVTSSSFAEGVKVAAGEIALGTAINDTGVKSDSAVVSGVSAGDYAANVKVSLQAEEGYEKVIVEAVSNNSGSDQGKIAFKVADAEDAVDQPADADRDATVGTLTVTVTGNNGETWTTRINVIHTAKNA